MTGNRVGNFLLSGLLVFLIGVPVMANDIEEPGYEVLETLEQVEIRRYQQAAQAFTVLRDNRSSSAGFRRLAGFIFGKNDSGAKIAMTAPVQETLGENSPEMAFTMPAAFTLSDLPFPKDSSVKLRAIPERTVAVVSFGGWANASRVERYRRVLEKTLKEHGLSQTGQPVLNQYNPPWTPPFKRRNEVAVAVQAYAVD